MGICWSEPPAPPVHQATVVRTYPACQSCGGWIKQSGLDYCEMCLQRNAMKVVTPSVSPSAPPYQTQQMQYQQQYPQYTYAVQQPYYPPQQQYPPQQYPYQSTAYISTPYNQQRPQMGTGAAIATGFVVGALMEDMLDPN